MIYSLITTPFYFLPVSRCRSQCLCSSFSYFSIPRQLLEREKQDLLNEMMALPQNAVVRRINELVKRARSVKVHAYIIHYLKKQMPYVIGKSEKQKKLLDRLDREFLACARRYNLPLGDFPNVDQYRKMLREVGDVIILNLFGV